MTDDDAILAHFMPDDILRLVDHHYPTATVVMIVATTEDGSNAAIVAGTHPTEKETGDIAAEALAAWIAEAPHFQIGMQGDG